MKFEIDKTKGSVLRFDTPEMNERYIMLESLIDRCIKRARKEFGDKETIIERIETEKTLIIETMSEATIAIVSEIAAMSRKMGYPVWLHGSESGLLIMYLLGVSGVHPKQYGYSTVPVYLFAEQTARHRFPASFEIAVAEQVKEKILPILEKKYGEMKSDGELSARVRLSSDQALEKIRELGARTGVGFDSIELDSDKLLSEVRSDVILYELGAVELLEKTRVDAAEYYAFAMCSSDVIKDRALFEKVSGFIYRDDVFDALITNGFDMREAYSVSRLWSRGEQRQAEIDLLRERGAPEELINAFRHLTNLWTCTECLSRTNMMQTLKYYEINFPDEYGKVTGRS